MEALSWGGGGGGGGGGDKMAAWYQSLIYLRRHRCVVRNEFTKCPIIGIETSLWPGVSICRLDGLSVIISLMSGNFYFHAPSAALVLFIIVFYPRNDIYR